MLDILHLKLIICTLIILFNIVKGEKHFCPDFKTTKKTETAPCSDFFDRVLKRWILDQNGSNLGNLTAKEAQSKINEWSNSPDKTRMCQYNREYREPIEKCCQGWKGDDCSMPLCNPPCLNGICTAPKTCQCEQGYSGIACDQQKDLITENMKYCFSTLDCSGKVSSTDPINKESCCGASGSTWGITGGACLSCNGDIVSSSDPTKPAIVKQKYNIGFHTCMNYAGKVFRTFDGLQYLFEGFCEYTVYSDATKTVTTKIIDCDELETCHQNLTFILNTRTTVEASGHNIFVNGKQISISHSGKQSLSNVKFEWIGDYIFLEYAELRAKWLIDGSSTWFISIDDAKSPRNSQIQGICGNFDGDALNDMRQKNGQIAVYPAAMANSFSIRDLSSKGEVCPDAPSTTFECKNDGILEEAKEKCNSFKKFPMSVCQESVDARIYISLCIHDFCKLSKKSKKEISVEKMLCFYMEMYTYECAIHGVIIDNVKQNICPRKCPANMTYKSCVPQCQKTCKSLYTFTSDKMCQNECVPGCQCEDGTYFDAESEKCVKPENCSCHFQAKRYHPGDKVKVDCNECQCENGRWICEQNPCPKECSVIGYQHFQTFDGDLYDLRGDDCEYTLVETETGESGKHNIKVKYEIEDCTDMVVLCTTAIIVEYQNNTVKVQKERDRPLKLIFNNKVMSNLERNPIMMESFVVKQVTSLFTVLQGFGFSIDFDANGRVYIYLSPYFIGKVKGLCGNMNGSPKDDRQSKANGPHSNLIEFSESYRQLSCKSLKRKKAGEVIDPCTTQSRRADSAQKICKILVDEKDVFAPCLDYIDGSYYQEMCEYDLCASDAAFGYKSLCVVVTAMAKKCLEKGIKIEWKRNDLLATKCSDSSYKCSNDKLYRECSSSAVNCRDGKNPLAHNEERCYAGCSCPSGQRMDAENRCVSIEKCTCYDESDKSSPYKKSGTVIKKHCKDCICVNGSWECKEADCSFKNCEKNQIWKENAVTCGVSCSDYSFKDQCGDLEYYTGCACPDGLLLSPDKSCVKPETCPCLHNGQLYNKTDILHDGCSYYACIGGLWKKTATDDEDCQGICKASGDPHYLTFDGKWYSFQGPCTYYLVQHKEISIIGENVPCGTTGATCTKSIKVITGRMIIHLIHGADVYINNVTVDVTNPIAFDNLKIGEIGSFTSIYFSKLKVTILWDKHTRVYIYMNQMYKGQVKGLCGNYDDDSENDFGESQNSFEFGSTWEVSGTCSGSPPEAHPCKLHPERFEWAKSICRVIKEGPVFAKCRQSVPNYELFYKDCLWDACGCNTGGDYECVCASIANFADECNRRAIPSKWRSQHLCPIMCTGNSEYRECGPSCPQTCKNIGDEKDKYCDHGPCVEGCYCKEGYILHNAKCIPAADCSCYYKETAYPKGSLLRKNCQNCTCINGLFNCVGDMCNITCKANEQKCKTAEKCILKDFVCDGMYDCPDLSDESNCKKKCLPTEFSCFMGKKCISMNYICDGKNDCLDNSDETGCKPPKCEKTEFQCANGRCIDETFRCDGYPDCGLGDKSDEVNCTNQCKGDKHFLCDNGECIPSIARCDLHSDCGDGSDEKDCWTTSLPNVTEVITTTPAPTHTSTFNATTFSPLCQSGENPVSYNYNNKIMNIIRDPEGKHDVESGLLGSGATWVDLMNLKKHTFTITPKEPTFNILLRIEFAVKNVKSVKVKFYCPDEKVEETDPVIPEISSEFTRFYKNFDHPGYKYDKIELYFEVEESSPLEIKDLNLILCSEILSSTASTLSATTMVQETTASTECQGGTNIVFDYYNQQKMVLQSSSYPKRDLSSVLKGSNKSYTEEGYQVQLTITPKDRDGSYMVKRLRVKFRNVAYYQIELYTNNNSIVRSHNIEVFGVEGSFDEIGHGVEINHINIYFTKRPGINNDVDLFEFSSEMCFNELSKPSIYTFSVIKCISL
ncbi:DgyrCDS3170 [Dimorphilus gyrociliatus]|uniref:DgyrCDS3170 n=1 Tax=Dimorphilus gyrociliatus TaxID=2664684 RepID=A0A7I8VDI8_9ANNE|nr:DgyrCDS3170 [Dimorphilus gyrociliatus]